MKEMKQIMKLLHLSENLKKELRHSWLSDGRRESVAEHTFRMSLMAILIEPYLDQKINSEKLLKMIIIHDLVEAEAGDVEAFKSANDLNVKKEKRLREVQAIEAIRDMLPSPLGQELYQLWYEFEDKNSYEAKVANAIDKLEVQIQHNEADLDTWLEVEYEMTFKMKKHVEFDSFLQKLMKEIEDEGAKKLQAANIPIEMYTS